MVRRLRRIPGHLRPRRLRLYGTGNGKSGTMSLARMFGEYRSAHEIDLARLTTLATAALMGELDPDSARARAELRRRSWRFHLEVDVAGLLSPFAGTLATQYPDARFVLLIRDCFSWLDSRVEKNVGRPGYVGSAIYAARYGRFDDHFAPEESVLRDAGLRPIASYLRAWADVSERVLRGVPAERLLVVRTEDLDSSAGLLARFAGVPVASVKPAHANHRTRRSGLLADVPASFVVEQAQEHCAGLMERYWGQEWCRLGERLPPARMSP
jgi:Sulfotransferase domain